jgi:hypothetical protein
MSVRRAQREIDSAEFTEWSAFDRIEPFGPERADLRAGIIAAQIAAFGGRREVTPGDFMPDFGRSRRQSPEEIELRAHQWLAATGRRAD